jgi:hypothetical protein
MRSSIRRSAGMSKFRSAIVFCMATARTALGNWATIRNVDDGPAELGDERQDHRLVRFEIAHRLLFVAPHEARVTGDVRGENSREATLVNMEALRPL